MKRASFPILTLVMMLFLSGALYAQDTFTTPPDITEQQTDRFFGEFMKMMTILGLIILLLFFISWFLKRYLNARVEQMNADSLVQIIERRPISAKTSIYVVEVEHKRVIIAESPTGVTLLGEYPVRHEKSRFEEALDKS